MGSCSREHGVCAVVWKQDNMLYSFPSDINTNLFDLLAPIVKILLCVAEKALKKKEFIFIYCRLIISVPRPCINTKQHDQACKQLEHLTALLLNCGLHCSVKLNTLRTLGVTRLPKCWNGLLNCRRNTGQKKTHMETKGRHLRYNRKQATLNHNTDSGMDSDLPIKRQQSKAQTKPEKRTLPHEEWHLIALQGQLSCTKLLLARGAALPTLLKPTAALAQSTACL